jgi:RNA polymerase sigma factor (sigma-70 family)
VTSGPRSPTDAQLVARCRADEAGAWDALVERFSRYVHAIVTQGYGLRGADAEDVFQEVFTRVWERLATLRSDEAVRPWIAQLTRRCCVDHLRAAGREVPLEVVDEQAADDAVAVLDEAMSVRDGLAELSPECREILDRFFARDESYRTIGDVLELPAGTVASRISRCLGKLRVVLEGRNAVPSPSGGQVTR